MNPLLQVLRGLVTVDPIGQLPDPVVRALRYGLLAVGGASVLTFLYYGSHAVTAADSLRSFGLLAGLLVGAGAFAFAGRGVRWALYTLLFIPLFFVVAAFLLGLFANGLEAVTGTPPGDAIDPDTGGGVSILTLVVMFVALLVSLGLAAVIISLAERLSRLLDRIFVALVGALSVVVIFLAAVFAVIDAAVVAYALSVPVGLLGLQLGLRYDEQIESFAMAVVGSLFLFPVVVHERLTSAAETLEQAATDIGEDVGRAVVDEGPAAADQFSAIVEEQTDVVVGEAGLFVLVIVGSMTVFIVGGASVHYYLFLGNIRQPPTPPLGQVPMPCADCEATVTGDSCPECEGPAEIVTDGFSDDPRVFFVDADQYPESGWSATPLVEYLNTGDVVEALLKNPSLNRFGRDETGELYDRFSPDYQTWVIGTDSGLHLIEGNTDDDTHFYIPYESIQSLDAYVEGRVIDPLLNTLRIDIETIRYGGTFQIAASRAAGLLDHLAGHVDETVLTDRAADRMDRPDGQDSRLPLGVGAGGSQASASAGDTPAATDAPDSGGIDLERAYEVPEGASLHHPTAVAGYEAEPYPDLKEYAQDAGIDADRSREELVAALCRWRGFEEGYTERPESWADLEEYSSSKVQQVATELGVTATQSDAALRRAVAAELGLEVPPDEDA